jgi:hypothetical protein
MRTTIGIEDDLLDQLKLRASRDKTSLSAMVNQAIRRGLSAMEVERNSQPAKFVQKTYDLGARFDVKKARWIADELADAEFMRRFMPGE